MTCPTCNLPQSDHTEDMAANCAVFDVLSAAALSGQDSEAESAPDAVAPPPSSGASSQTVLDRNHPSFHEYKPLSHTSISIASVLLGWCNDIKRELEEFANDGPVGPMVPYRLEAGIRKEDLVQLQASLTSLIKTLVALRDDVIEARWRLSGRVF